MKIVLKGTLMVAAVAIGCSALVAQDKPEAKPSKQAADASMRMPKPDPQMTKLIKMMSGNWTVTEKANPGPMMPKGGTGRGTATFTAGPGAMSLMEKYHSSGVMGSSFAGFGTFWWDAKAQVYNGIWCDTMTPGGCDSSGTTKWDGDNLVGTMTSDMNGQKMTTKFVYTEWKPNSFVMKMDMGPDPNSLKEAMVITYSRAGASSAKAAQ
jgi:hypothetical protein